MIHKTKKDVAAVAKALEDRISAGQVREGNYLPSVREVSRELGCASLTAHRAMKLLAGKGLVAAEPRHGYRVTGSGAAGRAQEVLVFIEDTTSYEGLLGDIYETQQAVLRRGALARGWISASLPYTGQAVGVLTRQLQEMRASALIFQDVGERFPPGLLSELTALGLPAVGLDASCVAPRLDVVMRDEAHGAALAAEYLVERGHRRIGWYGPLGMSSSSLSRFAGAAEALVAAGLDLDTREWRSVPSPTEDEAARAFLQRPDRPVAVLALWQTAARSLVRAAREMGLKLGRDLEVVGWALEEHFERSYVRDCPELRESCACVTWSMADVGRTVLARIAERRREPDLPAARILLPMKLREAGK
ncbi:MAG TPA: substrate-binding domain-containing protein [Planctomycetota bacterium]|nr:substrate-binding domain-containing protein [Planctomycetota bacterium]